MSEIDADESDIYLHVTRKRPAGSERSTDEPFRLVT